jgi:hypothetical protein
MPYPNFLIGEKQRSLAKIFIMHHISVKDFPQLDFGDKRRNERFVSIINNVSSQPGSSLPKQNENWYSTKATYEFFKNEEVSLCHFSKL